MVDDLGYAGLSCYGNPHYQTPELDRLADEGKRFTDFHSSGAVCSPTRAGLLTGRYQQRAGIEAVIHPYEDHPEHQKGLHKTEITFPELLKQAGYVTGIMGKWHLGYAKENPEYHPLNHGFDTFVGYLSGNIDYISHWGDHFEHDWWHDRKETREEGYTTHLITKHALDFIDKHQEEPFCLYVSHEAVHSPFQGPGDPVDRGPGDRDINRDPDIEVIKEMVKTMDDSVGQIRRKILNLGLDKNTFILFFSDNGGQRQTRSNSPVYRGTKGGVYEGGHRVPAIAWWPDRIQAGTESNETAISIDVMPTLLELASVDIPTGHILDGTSLVSHLLDNQSLPHRYLFWADLNNRGRRSEAMRDGPWKLVVTHPDATPGTFENERIELFRLDKDPGEKNNLAETENDRAIKMLVTLKQWYKDVTRSATPQAGGWLKESE
jgi:arylsulfatase A-like enzyme